MKNIQKETAEKKQRRSKISFFFFFCGWSCAESSSIVLFSHSATSSRKSQPYCSVGLD